MALNKGPLASPYPTQDSHSNSSTRSWKKKFEEWGYSKYIKTKGKKRELEGKDMDFRHVNNPIAPQRNQNFKRRKLRELSPSAGELFHPQCFLIIF
jgi:hypothetical protein